MIKKFSTQSLRFKILYTMLIVSVIPLFILAGLHFENTKKNFEDLKFKELESSLELKIQKIDLLIYEIKTDLKIVTQDEYIYDDILYHIGSNPQTNTEKEHTHEIDNWINNKQLFNEFLIIDKKGDIKFSSMHENVDHMHAPVAYVFDKINNFPSQEIYFTPVFVDDKQNMEMMALLPIYDSEEFLGLVGFEINLMKFYSIVLDDVGLGTTGEILLGQKSGDYAQLINPLKYTSNPKLEFQIHLDDEVSLSIREAVQGISSSGQTVDYRNEPIFAVWTHVPEVNWGIVAKIDSSEVYEPLDDMRLVSFVITVVTVVVIIMISSILTTKLMLPIFRLKNSVKQLEKGTYDLEIIVTEKGEIGQLANSLKTLRDTLAFNKNITTAYENEIEGKLKTETELRKALDESSIVAITDKNGVIQFVNNKFEEISKYSKDELIGKTHRIIKSDYHSPEFYSGLWNTITKGRVWKGDMKNKAKDGSFYWVKTTIVPFLDHTGVPFQYIAIRTNITRQKEIETRLSNALKENKKSELMKSEFASMITHELKTPLTPIRGYCEMLLEQAFGPLNEEQQNFIKTIESNADHLEQLIGDVLDVQKLDMNKMSFSPTNVNIPKFFAEIKNDFIPVMKEKQVQFDVDDCFDIHIQIDSQRLRQVFNNLIRNSLDFVHKNGEIKIGVIEKPDEIVFFVKDNGIGITKEKQKNIFKKFYQVDTTQTRQHGGTGLGLVVCKGIIEGQNGKIWLESESGKGTTFYFSFPREGKTQ